MYEYKVKTVDRVVDGDTVDIIIDLGFGLSKHERIRVAGVDTPEVRTLNLQEKALGRDASNFVEAWFAEVEPVIVRTEKSGKYGRMLGWFYRGDECLNDLLLTEGYAWAYNGNKKPDADDPATLLELINQRGYQTWAEYKESKQ